MPDETSDHPAGQDTSTPGTTLESDEGPVVVSGYEIEGVLGRGGMGVVYKARHQTLKRTVALKMLLAAGHAGPRELARFRIEAEAVARLQHPNIVQIHEVGEAGGHPFCALEYVTGGTLSRKIAGKPLPPADAARLLEPLSRGMQLAHSRNVIHRDLKPANILLAEDGTPKITDFGLARQLDADSGETQAGAVMGTPSYMAPEQASGRAHEAGPAADVYALGAILYECLTGKPPFKGKTVVETLDQVRNQEPVAPSRAHLGVPLDLETICLKCLRKEPENRYPSASALAEDLQHFLRDEPIEARPVGRLERARLWTRRNRIVATLLVGLVLAIIAGTASSVVFAVQEAAAREKADAEREQKEEQRKQAVKLAGEKASALVTVEEEKAEVQKQKGIVDEKNTALAKEKANVEAEKAKVEIEKANVEKQLARATFLVYAGQLREARVKLEQGRLDEAAAVLALTDKTLRGWEYEFLMSQTQRLVWTGKKHTSGVNAVAYSPVDHRIVSGSLHEVLVWDSRTGQVLLTIRAGIGPGRSVCFSPDGKSIATASSTGWALWDSETGKNIRTVGRLNANDRNPSPVSFSHDGKRLATSAGKMIAVWDVATGEQVLTLKGHMGQVTGVVYSPDQKHIASVSADTTAKIWDADTGEEVRTLKGHTKTVVALAYSPKGDRLATTAFDKTLHVWDSATGQIVFRYQGAPRLPIGPAVRGGWLQDLAYSPDGTLLAGCSWDQTVTVWETTRGQETLTLPAQGTGVNTICFSPDSNSLVSGVETGPVGGGAAAVRVWSVGLRQESLVFRDHGEDVQHVAYSSDGKRVATAERRSFAAEKQTVKVWDPVTGEVTRTIIVGYLLRGLAFSRDGKRLAACGVRFLTKNKMTVHQAELRVWDVATGEEVFNLKGHSKEVNYVYFTPDGTRIIGLGNGGDFDVAGGMIGEIRVWDAKTGAELVNKQPELLIGRCCFSADGKRLANVSQRFVILDTDTWQEVGTIVDVPRGGGVSGLCFSPDGTRLSGGSSHDNKVWIWDTTTGKQVGALTGHTNGVTGVAYSPDGKRIVTSSYDRTARIWDSATGEEALTLKGHTDLVEAVAFSPDARRIVSLSKDRTARVWNFGGADQSVRTIKVDSGAVTDIRFPAPGNVAAIVLVNKALKRFDPASWKETSSRPLPEGHAYVAVGADGRRFVSAKLVSEQVPGKPQGFGGDRKVWFELKVWDADTGQELLGVKNPDRFVTAVAFHSATDRIASAGNAAAPPGARPNPVSEGEIKLWDAKTGKTYFTIKGTGETISALVFSPDGKYLVGSGPGPRDPRTNQQLPPTVRVWIAETGELVQTLKGPTTTVQHVLFSADGKYLVSASGGMTRVAPRELGEIIIWEIAMWKEVRRIEGYAGLVSCVALTPDGTRIATGAHNRLTVWNATTGKLLRVLKGHQSPITAVAFTPDGTRIVTGSTDGALKMWDPIVIETEHTVLESAPPLPLPGRKDRLSEDDRQFPSGTAAGAGAETLVGG